MWLKGRCVSGLLSAAGRELLGAGHPWQGFGGGTRGRPYRRTVLWPNPANTPRESRLPCSRQPDSVGSRLSAQEGGSVPSGRSQLGGVVAARHAKHRRCSARAWEAGSAGSRADVESCVGGEELVSRRKHACDPSNAGIKV